ncbi:chemotaxis protein [Roseivivax halodurans JCM 10272]|uniref:Chemotaxis protein n=1 Tax=Roseivivax halodurans JCM 10272 TaxID=1449350 RepID=X7EL05_9RHOB|nr:methyl-accepting chemotaxis protein [Roseivivax halodurans]ETX16602.1 chemotaxis protein [Roseivivax halodurans JCM 10272]
MSRPLSSFSFRSVFVKSAVLCVVACLVVSVALSVVYSRGILQTASTTLEHEARTITDLMGDTMTPAVRFRDEAKVSGTLAEFLKLSEGLAAGGLALGADGIEIGSASTGAGLAPDLLGLAREALKTGERQVSADGLRVAVPLRIEAGTAPVGVFATQWTTEEASAATSKLLRYAALVTAILILVIVAATTFLYNRMIVGPIHTAKRAIEGLKQHDYTSEIPLTGRGDELGAIARALDGLRADLASGEAAQRSAAFQSVAFRNCSAALMLVDPDFTIREVNEPLKALFRKAQDSLRQEGRANVDPENMVGTSIDAYHPKSSPIRTRLQSMGKDPVETHIRLGIATVDLRIDHARDAAGNTIGYVLEWRDVSDIWFKNAMVDAIDASQLLCQFTVEGRVRRANERFCSAMKCSEDALVGRDLRDMAHISGKQGAGLSDAIAKVRAGTPFYGEFTFPLPGGGTAIVDGSLTCVLDRDGQPNRLVLLGKDVTRTHLDLEAARKREEADKSEREKVVDALRVGLRQLSAGDLTSRIDSGFAPDFEDLRLDFNGTVENLERAMTEILDSAANIRNETGDISTTADALSRRTESTAATLEQTAAALDMLTTSVRNTAEGATQADKAVGAARVNAEESSGVVLETVAAMDQIAASSEEITSIIKVIDDIAFQTNLLALNAGVEAARAGEAGRGFAVVASEVRALAQRSSDAAREIKELIAESGGQVQKGVDLVGRTGKALQAIANSVTEIAGLVSDIAGSAQQQSMSLGEINSSVTQLDQTTQQVAARLEETTAASEALRNDAVSLVDTLARFKMRQSGHQIDAAPAKAPAAQAPRRAVTAASAPQPVEKWADF